MLFPIPRVPEDTDCHVPVTCLLITNSFEVFFSRFNYSCLEETVLGEKRTWKYLALIHTLIITDDTVGI